MTRAEEAAMKAYPIKGKWVGNQYGEWDNDINGPNRNAFLQGYEQAEKDLAMSYPLPEDTVLLKKGVEEGRRLEMDEHRLTWEDIRRIVKIADDLLDDPKARVAFNNHNEEYYYKRVLDEYNKLHKAEAE